jgi:hypothetical protein
LRVAQRSEHHGAVCRVTVRGTDPAKDYALPDDMALPGDFAQAILKLPKGSGWVYLRKIFAEDQSDLQAKIQESHDVSTKKLLKSMQARPVGGRQDRMEAMAQIYTENFEEVQGPLPSPWRTDRRCIVFDSFSTCIRRFASLQKYPVSVHKELRRNIEAAKSLSGYSPGELNGPASASARQPADNPRQGKCHGPLLRPVPTSGTKAASTKLNAVQHSILENLKAPLDFVQGPPGASFPSFTAPL